MTSHTNLNSAKNAKNDEFYTQMGDIENELRHYKDHFRDKVVYCNCDHPRKSNFVKYFRVNFQSLGLKKLIASCYRNNQPDLFSEYHWEPAIWMEYTGKQMDIKSLRENGDFRSAECIELLKQSDIVVTNPPFSLFREYVTQLMEHDKKFLIIAPMNAIKYNEVFPLIKVNRLWMGTEDVKKFEVQENSKKAKFCEENGKWYQKFGNACWFTNLQHDKHNEELILSKTYSPQEYPRYDNYDAIDVSKVRDIPKDWAGHMGVPISFLAKHNPDQFEIVGVCNDPIVAKKPLYSRIIIRNKQL